MKSKALLIISLILSLSGCSNINTFTVTRKNYDGSVLEIDNGLTAGEMPSFDGIEPTREEDTSFYYTFDGWDKELSPVNSDVIYTAKFKANPFYYVKWVNADGTTLELDKGLKKGDIPKYDGETPTLPTDEDYIYTFIGRDKKLNPIDENLEIRAIYNTEPSVFDVQYVNYDGTLLQSFDDVKYGELALYDKEIPARESNECNYKFVGWSPKVSNIREDVTYVAQFEPYKDEKDKELSRIPTKEQGQIFLFGEYHNDEQINKEEYSIWSTYYTNYGFRHLLIERNVFTAEIVNAYMKAEDSRAWDELIYNIFANGGKRVFKYLFIKNIKKNFPETIFHGIDIASRDQNFRNPETFIKNFMKQYGLDSSYLPILRKCVEDSVTYYDWDKNDEEGKYRFREAAMTENIINTINNLSDFNIVGFFGGAHINKFGFNYSNYEDTVMANKIDEIYGENLYTEDLRLTLEAEKINVTIGNDKFNSFKFSNISIYYGGQNYAADLYVLRDRNAYSKFKDKPMISKSFYWGNLKSAYESTPNEVYVIEFYVNSRIERKYFRRDPWKNKNEFNLLTEFRL